MLGRMKRTRLTTWGGAGLLAVIAILAAGTAKEQNGQECLKDFDCESDTCVQHVCVDPNASRAVTTVDSGAPADTGPADTGTAPDTASDGASDGADTGPADTGADTGSS